MLRKRYVREHYAPTWVESVRRYGLQEYHEKVIKLLASVTAYLNINWVLDCAGGTGYPFAIELAKRGAICNLDIGSSVLEQCIRNAEKERLTVHCAMGDVETMPFKDETFELTYCMQSVWYFPHISKAIKEMFRVTKSGGYVIFDVQNLLNMGIMQRYLIRRITWLWETIYALLKRKPHPIVFETPSFPLAISFQLKRQKVHYSIHSFPVPVLLSSGLYSKLLLPLNLGPFPARLVYVCQK